MKDLIIDQQDLWLLDTYKYNRTREGYYYRSSHGKTVFIHHDIMKLKPNNFIIVDHINLNPSDNRRSNLRIVNKSINSLNKGKINRKHAQNSKYKGVSLCRTKKNYRAYCTINKKRTNLGVFGDQINAAIAYNLFIIKNVGYNIYLNEVGNDYKFFTPFPIRYMEKDSWDSYINKKGKYSYIFKINESKIKSKNIKELIQIRYIFYRIILNNYRHQNLIPMRISCV